MVYSILNFSINFLVKRSSLIVINIATLIFSIYLLFHLYLFLSEFNAIKNYDYIREVNNTINDVACVLIALGWFLYERGTIKTISKTTPMFHEDYINLVSKENGLGYILLGLGVQVITLLIDIPNRIIDTRKYEYALFIACFFFLLATILIEIDLIKDYIKTYFIKTKLTHEKK